jgi:hypothetical protein
MFKGGTSKLHGLREVHGSCTGKARYLGVALVKGGTWELHKLREVHGSCTS